MFRSFTRIPLRRCLHTIPPRPPPSQGSSISLILGLGATIGAVAYFSNSGGRRIALDTPPGVSYKPPSPSSSAFSESSASKTAPEDVLETSDSADPSGGGFASLADGEGSSGEEDGASGGAFNPVTGEINWDCPCLGGMAHGVCGSQFREAFSCFVFSEEEPKGINCVEKFKHMQDCFREHPDVYGEEIMDDDDEDETSAPADADASVQAPEVTTPSAETTEVETSEGSLPQAQSA